MTPRNPRGPRRRAAAGVEWHRASLFPEREGLPWWAAVLAALGLATTGALIDLARIDRLGVLFQASYFFGCLLAVMLVQRKGLFGPMVQPPLILALAVPSVVLIGGGAPPGDGIAAKVLAVATPLIDGFPTMAVTTVLTLALGAFRLVTQRPEPNNRRPPQQRPRPSATTRRDRPAVSRRSRSTA